MGRGYCGLPIFHLPHHLGGLVHGTAHQPGKVLGLEHLVPRPQASVPVEGHVYRPLGLGGHGPHHVLLSQYEPVQAQLVFPLQLHRFRVPALGGDEGIGDGEIENPRRPAPQLGGGRG